LIWPETYASELKILGHDVSGVVLATYEDSSNFKAGDEVYGMINMEEGCSWAEYVVADSLELAPKPRSLSWAESVTVPMSGLTAWEALFDKAGIPEPDLTRNKPQKNSTGENDGTILVTGASGMVGAWVVQLAALTDRHVVAASSSNARNREFLKSLGATEVVEYAELDKLQRSFDTIIDTAGGDTLAQSWSLVSDDGIIITVDSNSFDIETKPKPAGKEHVKAIFFIVTASGLQLTKLTKVMDLGLARAFVSETFPLGEARAAYERASGRLNKRGKVVLQVRD
jgi:NADPH:quinone reductase-like Zn-dependent oxidoreductase